MKNLIVVAVSAALSNALAKAVSFEKFFTGPINKNNPLDSMRAYGMASVIELMLIFAIVYWVLKTIVHGLTDTH